MTEEKKPYEPYTLSIPQRTEQDLQIVTMTADQEALANKSLKDIYGSVGHLHQLLKEGKLTYEMRNTLMSLIESYVSELGEPLEYAGTLKAEQEKRYKDIRRANGEIHRLREQLGSSKPIDGLDEQLGVLHDTVRDWWNNHGFCYVSEDSFTQYGYKVKFGFMLSSMERRSFTKTPVSDEQDHRNRLQELKDAGFEIYMDDDGRDPQLIDNDNNRQLLEQLIKSRFPSAQITSIQSWKANRRDCFVVRYMDVTIRDYQDVPAAESESEEGQSDGQ
ncbi:hypothetical protein GZH47_33420 (plasmid) [Paenibacillus rhizovicinus]|uniref:Uncharacterized protein n=1 Tax=Paenibacillus rhizovicinus TaxID=2704463 RepID=A0A6C0PBP9_9BACL|nr:hypothetical protein [Paenibacillus rhizovicinus]QHW35795.1 hypothetical protein GZH47_33420 [Paenibacillus rhizovicinus]